MMFWPCWIAPADYLSVLATQGNSMSTKVHVKFCGLRSAADIAAAVAADARYVGFVFFPKSPRHISFEEATALALEVPDGICKVALTVNADDAFLDALLAVVPIDMLQLHGSETPARVREVKARYGLPVMKAVGVADAGDLDQLDQYMAVADQILVDAKPPKGGDLPGGNGLAFDWRLIAGREWPKPWMLAGGLTPDNVAEAVQMTGARQVDVSSGVETAPGVKDAGLIAGFGQAAQKPVKA
jgi:phosphoribosylanthranilate isomerase